jgi:Tol biopolymer transport system component
MHAARLMRISPLKVALVGALLALVLAGLVLMMVAPEKAAHAAFPGENGKIVFHSNRNLPDNTNPDGDLEIFTMEPDGSHIEQLTDNGADDSWPSFSPDGTQITFLSPRDGNTEIYTMNADGSNQARLTHNATEESYPAFFPDGERIAFATDRDGNTEI